MRLEADEARRRFGESRVARLATSDPVGQPHVVPIVFVLVGEVLYSAVDHKPKSTTKLKRLANIASNPSVAVLVDHYEDDWTALWWVRADGAGRLADGPEAEAALGRLVDKYPQYVDEPPPGPVLAIDVQSWTGWSAS